jgi:heat shock protein HtpX
VVPRQVGSTMQHMLLVGNEPGAVAHWLDSHPTLEQRVRRIYGRSVGPLSLERREEAAAAAPVGGGDNTGSPPDAPGWTLS